MDAFQNKILLRQTWLVQDDLQMFSNFDEYMKENYVNQQVVTLVKKHLESLTEPFARYYLRNEDLEHGNMWVIDPFAAKIQDNNLSMHLKVYHAAKFSKLNFIHPYQDISFGFP
ncbi:dimer_Tnp_hAT domain-containing protein [Trichonephila clavipes]|nr:dimer_Tnp_hAT domain-containing protein [Trichonephila clavipes]